MSESESLMLVTKKQLNDGYTEFRPNEIPNIVRHSFVLIRQLSDDVYEVKAPKARP